MKKLQQRTFAVVLLLIVTSSSAYAGAISIKFGGFGFSVAAAVVPGDFDLDVDGVLFGPTQALAVAGAAGGNLATAQAKTDGLFDIDVDAGVVFGIGLADVLNPFVDPINPVSDVLGQASLAYDASFAGSTLTVAGINNYNENGFLELGVLQIANMTFAEIAQALQVAGSVEKAVALDLIDPSQVIATYRESQFSMGSFGINVSIGNFSESEIVLTGLAHAVSVPEPTSFLLLTTGGMLLVFIRRSKKGSKGRIIYRKMGSGPVPYPTQFA